MVASAIAEPPPIVYSFSLIVVNLDGSKDFAGRIT